MITQTKKGPPKEELHRMAAMLPPPTGAQELLHNKRTVAASGLLQTSVEVITPEVATKWLEGNTHNRPLRQRDVDRYSREMSTGRWQLNGESIIFDSTGRLLDGQHRLWACVESQVSFQAVVVRGADPETFTTIDQGRHRSPADHLVVAGVTVGGEQHTKVLAAAASLVWRYRHNQVFSQYRLDPGGIIELCRTEPGLEAWVKHCRRAGTGLRGFTAPMAAVLHIGSCRHREAALAFAEGWVSGANLAAGSPILTLRQRVLSKSPTKAWERLFIASSAWNAFAQQRPLLKMGSMRSDNFPRIVGDQ
jgi:hypothetical protein